LKFNISLNSEYNQMVNKILRIFAVSCLLIFSDFTLAVTPEQLQQLQNLSPDQLQQLKQMSPEQRAALQQQAGAGVTPAGAKVIVPPPAMQSRETGMGRLEYDMKTPSVDAKLSNVEVVASPQANVPVEQVSGKATENVEVRRGFEAFARESKPMTVSTEGLQQFGYELFASQPSTFAPATDIPVPPEYVLGPGDEIKVQMFGKDNLNLALTVDREGAVSFPQIGPISLAGLSFAQAKATLADQIKQRMIGVSASITMGQLRSIRIFALGDVYRPGSYTVSGLATLSHALFASGGVKKIGSLRNIELKRNGRKVTTIDLYDFLLKGNTSRDVRLLPGDVVFVPTIGKTVAIAGEVVRPAIYELAGETNVGDILKLSGGLLPNAYTSKALIERFNPKGDKQVVNIDLSGSGLSAPIKNGDVIKVFTATDYETNQVLLVGNVKRPGKVAWNPGMKVLDLISSRDDLLPESLMDYGIIESEAEDTREPVVTRFKLGELMEKGKAAGALNVALKPRDRVYVFQRANFREQPKLTIVGSVQTPGQYELKRNMRLADLVLAAGGILRDTDLGTAEIYRTDPLTKMVSLNKVNLAGAMASQPEDDFLLQDLDRVVIHSVYETKLNEMVTISGQVHRPGTVPLSEGMRIADLVFAGGNVSEFAFLKKARLTRYKIENGEKRVSLNIDVDLSSALQGIEAANLPLEPYDILYINRINDEPNLEVVSVFGEVHKPSNQIPLIQGMRIADLLFAAGNVTERAYLAKGEVTRFKVVNGERRESEHFEVDLSAALKGDEKANIVLQPYDNLTVRRLSGWNEAEQVTILGEVQHKGAYPIQNGERLSDVLARTGGFTKDAYLPAAIFIRESIRVEQQKQLDEMVRRMEAELAKRQETSLVRDATLAQHKQEGEAAASRILDQLKSVRATGRLVIELADIETLKKSHFDIQLRDGDKLYIPKRPDEVLVLGEVYNQSALIYEPGKSANAYLKDAGVTRMADTSEMYYVRANGKIETKGWLFGNSMQPGDAIVVPVSVSYFNLLDSVLDWSRATMQIATTIATLKYIGVVK
jgi:protein involved in polysaccharide export with SLBB domain